MRLIDADRLIKLMTDRDDDCGEPKNAFDKGYSLAVEHMKWEIEQNNDYHCKTFDLAEHDKLIRNEVIDKFADSLTCQACFTNMQKDAIRIYAEQLKGEQKNDD